MRINPKYKPGKVEKKKLSRWEELVSSFSLRLSVFFLLFQVHPYDIVFFFYYLIVEKKHKVVGMNLK